jgi:hypothetical protein
MSACIHPHCPTNGAWNSDTPFKTAAPCTDRTASQHWHQHRATGLHKVTINNDGILGT